MFTAEGVNTALCHYVPCIINKVLAQPPPFVYNDKQFTLPLYSGEKQ